MASSGLAGIFNPPPSDDPASQANMARIRADRAKVALLQTQLASAMTASEATYNTIKWMFFKFYQVQPPYTNLALLDVLTEQADLERQVQNAITVFQQTLRNYMQNLPVDLGIHGLHPEHAVPDFPAVPVGIADRLG